MIDNTVVYVVSYEQSDTQHRTKKLVSLRKNVSKLIFVTKKGVKNHTDNLVIGSYPNPFSLLRYLGFTRFKLMVEKLAFFPSEKILYVYKAVRKLRSIIEKDIAEGKKCCIITCVPHHDIAVIGSKLKAKIPQIRWIVDWQDLWSYDDYYFRKIHPFYRHKLLKLEENIFSSSDFNVVTNTHAKNILIDTYKVNPKKVAAIYHPYDSEDKDFLHTKPKTDNAIHIGFLGGFYKYPKVRGDIILDVIDELQTRKLNIHLHIIGDKSDYIKNSIDEPRKRYVSLYPFTDHAESLSYLKGCDFLMLCLSDLPNCNIIVHGKLPHYLVFRIPILAIVPENSAVADIIYKTQSGYVIPSNENITEKLFQILKHYDRTKFTHFFNNEEISKFSWEYISKQWIEVIKN